MFLRDGDRWLMEDTDLGGPYRLGFGGQCPLTLPPLGLALVGRLLAHLSSYLRPPFGPAITTDDVA